MKSIFRLICLGVMLSGWIVAGLCLYVVRVPDPANPQQSNLIVIPKNRLAVTDTYVDARSWRMTDVASHPLVVLRLLRAGKADDLKFLADPKSKKDVEGQLLDVLSNLPAPTTTASSIFASLRGRASSSNIGAMNAHLILHADSSGPIINPNIYGQFAEHLGGCIYGGIWVGEDSPIPNMRGLRNDVLAALKNLRVPVVRWPGGCFADEYHWRDGIGPRDQRPRRINTHWGAVVENNHFGTHEFLDFCELIGTQPYVCGNVGSGTPQEMMEWVEYMTSDSDSTLANERRRNGREKPWNVPWFGVGNESWGCGGNMRPEYYADKYRQYRTFVKNYSGNRVQAIACGSNGTDFNWTDVLMREAQRLMHGLSMHWYALPTNVWAKKGSATEFGEDQYHSLLRQTLEMERLVSKHSEIMDKHDPEKRIGLIVDEWGTWYDPEPGTNPGFLYQQNTLRDCAGGGGQLPHFSPALRSGDDGQHCADDQCASGDDFDGGGEDGADADLSRV